jgi:capping protein beta
MVKDGCWDSIHIVEVTEDGPKKATYKLTTTISLHINVDKEVAGQTLLAGTVTRQVISFFLPISMDQQTIFRLKIFFISLYLQSELTSAVNENKTHIANIGRMIEDMEIETRGNLYELYIMKTREVINSIRNPRASGPEMSNAHVNMLNAAIFEHGKTRKLDSENSV